MTYHGGLEDGKAALASQILSIITVNITMSAQERLDKIEKLCLFLKKDPLKESTTKTTIQ